MNKSIYNEVIKVVNDLTDQYSHIKDNRGTVFIPSQQIKALLEKLLIHSFKRDKLLELYKEALETNFEGITLIKLVNKTLRTQIKELENNEK